MALSTVIKQGRKPEQPMETTQQGRPNRMLTSVSYMSAFHRGRPKNKRDDPRQCLWKYDPRTALLGNLLESKLGGS